VPIGVPTSAYCSPGDIGDPGGATTVCCADDDYPNVQNSLCTCGHIQCGEQTTTDCSCGVDVTGSLKDCNQDGIDWVCCTSQTTSHCYCSLGGSTTCQSGYTPTANWSCGVPQIGCGTNKHKVTSCR
jgi:hypothetical protein